jgi:hypothetical protein
MYHNCAVERMASYINNVSRTHGDVPATSCSNFITVFLVMGTKELTIKFFIRASRATLLETKRARVGLANTKTLLRRGIDIDIPTGANHSNSRPKGTQDAVLAAFSGRADGVILSRKYSEMKLTNLAAAGAAIHQWARLNDRTAKHRVRWPAPLGRPYDEEVHRHGRFQRDTVAHS